MEACCATYCTVFLDICAGICTDFASIRHPCTETLCRPCAPSDEDPSSGETAPLLSQPTAGSAAGHPALAGTAGGPTRVVDSQPSETSMKIPP
ncbi:hypothetical protein M408DRAFT_329959 [Serendipita vermifera MAFF 305830]|uniref:Uncharacterized protein n=1 Tax=Serendipita vermifera MAFF 305830 TaxID=933852 RepID=A0A0C2WMK8_SERVB|nr:hypothetical protein M408DRAFT_329959 [Serendipita vermifera MAFF 305830]